MSSEGTHQAHCCRRHGCKYGDAKCPVVTGEAEQYYRCEHCDADAAATAELLGDELREMTASELFLELAVACKATGHNLAAPVSVAVLGADGTPTLRLARMRVVVSNDGGRVAIEVQEAGA